MAARMPPKSFEEPFVRAVDLNGVYDQVLLNPLNTVRLHFGHRDVVKLNLTFIFSYGAGSDPY